MRLLLLFVCFSAAGQELQRPPFEAAFFVGGTFAPRENQKAINSVNGGTSIVRANDSGKSAFAMGLEGTMNLHDQFGVALIGDVNQYIFSDGSRDRMFFIGVAPKFRKIISDQLALFAAAGVGLARNKLQSTQTVSDGIQLIVRNKSDDALALSPRAGVEFRSPDGKVAIIFQVVYTWATFEHKYDVSSYPAGVTLGNGTATMERSWFTGFVGIGGDF